MGSISYLAIQSIIHVTGTSLIGVHRHVADPVAEVDVTALRGAGRERRGCIIRSAARTNIWGLPTIVAAEAAASTEFRLISLSSSNSLSLLSEEEEEVCGS